MVVTAGFFMILSTPKPVKEAELHIKQVQRPHPITDQNPIHPITDQLPGPIRNITRNITTRKKACGAMNGTQVIVWNS
jgi:hypothetical protein